MNCWQVRLEDGHAITYDCKKLSGLCANRQLLIKHYEKRVQLVEQYIQEHGEEGLSKYIRQMGFEPGTHNREQRVDDLKAEGWRSAQPNIDIRHTTNTTPSRWSQAEFRDQRNCQNWQEAEEVPGWGKIII